MHQMKTDFTDLHLLRIPLPFRLNEVNLYLLMDSSGAILIDTGPFTEAAIKAFNEQLKRLGISWENIHTVLITHYHSDHCGLAAEIKKRSGATIYMARQDAELLQIFLAHPDRIVGDDDLYIRHGMPGKMVAKLRAVTDPLMELIPSFEPDHFFKDDQPIILEPFTFVPIHTPGHSPGHTCLFEQKTGVFFSGDHVLPEITPNIAAHPESPLEDPIATFLRSLESIMCLDVAQTFPAHGSLINNLSERVSEIILHHMERKLEVEKILAGGPASTHAIAMELFNNNLPLLERWMAFYETLAHIVNLENEGRIKREDGADTILFSLP